MSRKFLQGRFSRWCLLMLMLTPLFASARPVIYEETAKFTLDGYSYGPYLDGSTLLIPNLTPHGVDLRQIERQSDGSWKLVGTITTLPYEGPSWGKEVNVAIRGNIAAFSSGHNQVALERGTNGWAISTLPVPADRQIIGLEVRGGVIAAATWQESTEHIGIILFQKGASGWNVTTTLDGGPTRTPDPGFAFTGTEATLSNYNGPGDDNIHAMHIFKLNNGTWSEVQTLPESYEPLVLDDQLYLKARPNDPPNPHFADLLARDSTGQWSVRIPVIAEEQWQSITSSANIIAGANGRLIVTAWDDESNTGARGTVAVLERSSDNRFLNRATLVGGKVKKGDAFAYVAAVSGNRVIVQGRDAQSDGSGLDTFHVFELPASIPGARRIQDTFEDANASGWSVYGTSNWSVTHPGNSFVYRQANTQGTATALYDGYSASNESIEADLKITSAGTDSWSGLVARYADSNNYYYLKFANNAVQIRRKLNGSFTTLTNAALTASTNSQYRVRLEAVGTWLRAFVNDKLVGQVRDTALKSGKAGLTTVKSAAEFDNVIISSSPQRPLATNTFEPDTLDMGWSYNACCWNVGGDDTNYFYHPPVNTGQSWALTGTSANDQQISVDVRAASFNSNGKGYLGVIARRQDAQNYYYGVITAAGKAAIRKVQNGATTTVAETAFKVSANTNYRIRLGAISSALRLYVNGKLLVEGSDGSYAHGQYGVISSDAASQFDNVAVVCP